jgi:hypothetical protein
MTGELADDVTNCIRAFSEQLKSEIMELNVQVRDSPTSRQ